MKQFTDQTHFHMSMSVFSPIIWLSYKICWEGNKDVYIMGDMNNDLIIVSDHGNTVMYLENMCIQGFLPLTVKPTRLTSYSATLIVHIYYCWCHRNVHNNKSHRSFSKTNIDNCNVLLTNTDFTPAIQATCPDTTYTIFIQLYLETYDNAFPLKHSKTPRKYIKHLPWFTKGLV